MDMILKEVLDPQLLYPIVALILWTRVMSFWLLKVRAPRIAKYGGQMDPRTPKAEIANAFPPEAQWVADNYNHLFEQPVVFYALMVVMTLLGIDSQLALICAWGFVVSRVLHSLIQCLGNILMRRFMMFMVSNVCLMILEAITLLHIFG